MRILWVEDHGDEISDMASALKEAKHEIEVEPKFHQAIEKLKTLDRYDGIIIDINLEAGSNRKKDVTMNLKTLADLVSDQRNSTIQAENVLSEFGREFSYDDFLKEAGLFVFNYLIENGFPKKHIIFLTANVSDQESDPIDQMMAEIKRLINDKSDDFFSQDKWEVWLSLIQAEAEENNISSAKINDLWDSIINDVNDQPFEQSLASQLYQQLDQLIGSNKQYDTETYNGFRDHFMEARMIIPGAIKRGDESSNTQDLQDWIDSFNTDYAKLRRGILDGCDYGLLNLNCLVNNEPKEFNKSVANDFLQVLKKMLPIQIEKASKGAKGRGRLVISAFARMLVHDWDHYKFKCPPKRRLPKIARNFLAHDKLIEGLVEEKDVAFIFLVTMRYLFDYRKKTEEYENILLDFFGYRCDIKARQELLRKCRESIEAQVGCCAKPKHYSGEYVDMIELLNINKCEEKNDGLEINYIQELYRIYLDQDHAARRRKNIFPDQFANSFFLEAFPEGQSK